MTTQIASISVVIPSYNRSKTISYCLDSVLRQTFPPMEVIVVDDCSADETVEIVRRYPDPRVRCVILDKNAGAQAARNRGIKEARGEWIAFQDSDDEWVPDKLERQWDALLRTGFAPMTVVHGNCWRYYPEGDKKELWILPVVEGDRLYPLLLGQAGPVFPNLLTSKVALERIGYLDENVPSYQEWDTSIRLARYCRFIHIREPLFIYHLHDGETISKDSLRDSRGYLYILEKFREDIVKIYGKTHYEDRVIQVAFRGLDSGYKDFAVSAIDRLGLKSLRSLLAYLQARSHTIRRCNNLALRIFRKIKRTISNQ